MKVDHGLRTVLVCLAMALGTTAVAVKAQAQTNTTLSAESIRELLKSGAILLDVRTEAEFSAQHLPGAVNVPLDTLEQKIPRVIPDRQQPIFLHCRSGRRSTVAEQRLRAMGYQRVINLGSYRDAERLVTGREAGGR